MTKDFAPSLKVGDEVVTLATGSYIEDKEPVINGLKVLESWGLICRPHFVFEQNWGYLAGEDSIRLNNLQPRQPAPLLACAKGGWGSARLLEYRQKWRNGWLLGFSDVTALLWARLSAGFDGNIHGPLLSTLAKEPDWSKSRLKSILFGSKVPDLKGEPWAKGGASGPLLVANLTVATHLLGTEHLPELQGSILVLEDVDEEPYRIDRMLTQWRLAGLLQQLGGLGFGQFKGCDDYDQPCSKNSFQLEEVLKERSLDLNIPVVGNLPIGHCCGNAALPLGRTASLNGTQGLLKLVD